MCLQGENLDVFIVRCLEPTWRSPSLGCRRRLGSPTASHHPVGGAECASGSDLGLVVCWCCKAAPFVFSAPKMASKSAKR